MLYIVKAFSALNEMMIFFFQFVYMVEYVDGYWTTLASLGWAYLIIVEDISLVFLDSIWLYSLPYFWTVSNTNLSMRPQSLWYVNHSKTQKRVSSMFTREIGLKFSFFVSSLWNSMRSIGISDTLKVWQRLLFVCFVKRFLMTSYISIRVRGLFRLFTWI